MWMQLGQERVGRIGRVALVYIPYVKGVADEKLLRNTGNSTWRSVTAHVGGREQR